MSEVETRIQQGTDGQGRGPRVVTSPAELAAAREARGMSQIDVSQRIKLQVRQVAALEEGNWDLLPGRAFARGALRSYGKLIQADVTQLLEMIGTTDATAQLPRHALSSSVGPVTKSVYDRESRSGTWLWVIGGVVAAGALIFHFGSGSGGLFDRDGAAATTTITTPGSSSVGAAPAATKGSTASGSIGGGSAGNGSSGSGSAGSGSSGNGSPGSGSAGSGAGGADAATGGNAPSGALAGQSAQPASTASAASAASAATATPLTPPASPASGPAAAGTGPGPGGSVLPSTAPAGTGLAGTGSAASPGSAGAGTAGGLEHGGSKAPSVAGSAAAGSSTTAAVVSHPPGSIRFLPTEDSWVRVTDATGKKLHEALIPAGTAVTVQGKPPYKLRMGNARHLQIHFEGKEVRVPAPNEKNITLLELP